MSAKKSEASLVESSNISEEIRDEVDMAIESMIPDEIGTMSMAKTGTNAFSQSKSKKLNKSAVSVNKFSNSYIDEESAMGFTITGGGKGEKKIGRMNETDDLVESSIADELSIAGFGGSKSLQGRIVAKKDATGRKQKVEEESVREIAQ